MSVNPRRGPPRLTSPIESGARVRAEFRRRRSGSGDVWRAPSRAGRRGRRSVDLPCSVAEVDGTCRSRSLRLSCSRCPRRISFTDARGRPADSWRRLDNAFVSLLGFGVGTRARNCAPGRSRTSRSFKRPKPKVRRGLPNASGDPVPGDPVPARARSVAIPERPMPPIPTPRRAFRPLRAPAPARPVWSPAAPAIVSRSFSPSARARMAAARAGLG